MSLSPAQLATLKTAILADPELAVFYNIGNLDGLAHALNVDAVPTFVVWREDYTVDQIASAIEVGVTQLDALTASKRDSLLWWAQRGHDARKATTQAAITDLCGSQNTLKNALLDGAKRNASVFEKIFATGTGSAASPGVTTVIGPIAYTELSGL
jgi:hypothetical protein